MTELLSRDDRFRIRWVLDYWANASTNEKELVKLVIRLLESKRDR